jgi:hypothetical protein
LKDAFLESILKRSLKKGRQGEPPLPWSLFIVISWVHFHILSINKARYVLTFIDDYSCYTWVYFLRKKSEVFEHLKDFKALVETHRLGRKSRSFVQTMGGSISTKMFKIFVVRLVSSCNIQFHTLHSRMELLKGRTDLSRR